MLALTMHEGDYVTIGGDIVVKVTKISGQRCLLAIQADQSVPIVRGQVLERGGGARPGCLTPPK